MKIAIIGTGVSGLVAAYYLHPDHDITVFEQNDYVGGHSNTVVVTEHDREVALDTGFLVYNERTYPCFTRLLRELRVASQPSEMSFSVRCRRCAVEYCGQSLRGVFARTDQLFRPRFHRMLFEILRFNRAGAAWLRGPRTTEMTLGSFLRSHGFSRDFVHHYITPMASAIWSSTTADSARLPLEFFLRFFDNHGLLAVNGQPAWRTITGGSRQYVRALTQRFADRIHLRRPVRHVRRRMDGVELSFDGGTVQAFDKVILAAHSNQVLRLLADPDQEETRALRALPYQANEAVLHTDARMLPRHRSAWAAWNYHMDDCERVEAALPMTYYLNRLQSIDSPVNYCVTLNDRGTIARDRIIRRIPYEHPVFTPTSLAAQHQLRQLSGQRHTFYCGAYLGFGFHEDGVRSALDVVRSLETGREAA